MLLLLLICVSCLHFLILILRKLVLKIRMTKFLYIIIQNEKEIRIETFSINLYV